MRVQDKVIVITGAGRGIGLETARLMVREGARVVACDRDAAGVAAFRASLGDAAGQVMAEAVDVTDRGAIQAMVARAIAHWGRIDVLINNAGITQDATLAKMSEAQFDSVIAINLKGVFNVTQAVLPHMIAAGGGKIVSASSVVGIYGNFGQTNYAASKAGVIGMTKSWSKELARKGITANAVAPGFVVTDMTQAMPETALAQMKDRTPLGRLGTPADIAKAYLFLASSDADFITGQVLGVDGGLVV